MHITGPLKDYYDTVMHHGIDKSLVFIRNNKIINFTSDNTIERDLYKKYLCTTNHRWYSTTTQPPIFNLTRSYLRAYHNTLVVDNINCIPFIVLFCGKEYPGVRITFTRNKETHHFIGEPKILTYYVYEEQQVRALMKTYEKDIEVYDKNKSGSFEDTILPKMIKLFSTSGTYHDDIAEYMYNQRIAYCILSQQNVNEYGKEYIGVMEHHPLLKDIEFVKKMDPFTAYQEISMFVGNTPVSDRTMVILTDKEQLFKKGFDNKSFKKDPTKKRK